MDNRQYAVLFALMIGASALAPATSYAAEETKMSAPSLYHRLGGYDAIAAVTDDFIGRLATDPQFARFFTSLSTDSKLHLRQLVVDQLCAATGGPCVYIGRSMKQAHKGLGITKADWEQSVAHLTASLNKFHVAAAERRDVLAAVGQLEPDIVEK